MSLRITRTVSLIYLLYCRHGLAVSKRSMFTSANRFGDEKPPKVNTFEKNGFKLKDWGKSMTRTTTATISLFSKIKIIKGDLSLFKTLIVFKTSPGLRFSYISRIPIIFNFVLCTNLTFITIPIRIPRSNTKLIFIIY